jgi:hypothetical protein
VRISRKKTVKMIPVSYLFLFCPKNPAYFPNPTRQVEANGGRRKREGERTHREPRLADTHLPFTKEFIYK